MSTNISRLPYRSYPLIVAGSYIGADMLSRKFEPKISTRPAIELVDNTYAAKMGTLSILFPGLGYESGAEIAKAMAPHHLAMGNLAFANYPRKHLGIDELSESVVSTVQQLGHVGTLNFFGHSMGGRVALEVARNIENSYDGQVNIHLLATPYDLESVIPNRRLLYLLDKIPYEPGMFSKFLAVLGRQAYYKHRLDEAHFHRTPTLDLARVAMHGPTPELIRNQYHQIDEEVVIPNNVIRIAYYRPDQPKNDPIVDVIRSAQMFKKVFPGLEVITVAGAEHASIARHPRQYYDAFDQHLYNSEQLMAAA